MERNLIETSNMCNKLAEEFDIAFTFDRYGITLTKALPNGKLLREQHLTEMLEKLPLSFRDVVERFAQRAEELKE